MSHRPSPPALDGRPTPPGPEPSTITLPAPLRPPVDRLPTDLEGLRVVGSDEEFRLSPEAFIWVIGASERADIVLRDDPFCSQMHAVLIRQPDGRFVIKDNGSKNHTYVSGCQCLGLAYVVEGSRIRIGRHELLAYTARSRAARLPIERLIAHSEAFARARDAMLRVAGVCEHALLVGPRGSGRTTMAQALHQASARATGPFVELDGEAPDQAGTAQVEQAAMRAEGGTLLVRHVESLPERTVARLVRLLRGSEPASEGFVRVVMTAEVGDEGPWNALRPQATVIELPAIWERIADVPQLVRLFTRELGCPPEWPLPALDVAALAGRTWDEDVADLRRAVRRAVADSADRLDLSGVWPDDEARDRDLRVAIARALAQLPSRRAAASALGVPWSTFFGLAQRWSL